MRRVLRIGVLVVFLVTFPMQVQAFWTGIIAGVAAGMAVGGQVVFCPIDKLPNVDDKNYIKGMRYLRKCKFEKAIKKFQLSYQAGVKEASHRLGETWRYKAWVASESKRERIRMQEGELRKRAQVWFEKGAQAGIDWSMVRLGNSLLRDSPKLEEKLRAQRLFQKAVDIGLGHAYYELALYEVEHVDGAKKEVILSYIEKALQADCAHSYYLKGLMHLRGWHFKKDKIKARRNFILAANRGSVEAVRAIVLIKQGKY